MSSRGTERPRRDKPRLALSASSGCRLLSCTLRGPRPHGLLRVCARSPLARRRVRPDLSNFWGIRSALTAPLRLSPSSLAPLPPTRHSPNSLPRGSGREGGVSGAGGRELYKSAGGALAWASIATLSRDPDRSWQHGRWSGRCARAAQCVDYLQPLLVQYAAAPKQLNGVATPLPGLDHSAAFPYEEDTSE